jgi:hypothetical protein
MDLLRFLIALPIRLVVGTYDFLAKNLPPLFGRVSWSPPPWTSKVDSAVRKQPKQYAGGIAGVILAIFAAWGGYQWYLQMLAGVNSIRCGAPCSVNWRMA